MLWPFAIGLIVVVVGILLIECAVRAESIEPKQPEPLITPNSLTLDAVPPETCELCHRPVHGCRFYVEKFDDGQEFRQMIYLCEPHMVDAAELAAKKMKDA